MTRRLVQVRLDDALVRVVDHLSVEWGLSRAATMERLLREGVGKYPRWPVQELGFPEPGADAPRTRPGLVTRL